MTFGHHDLQDLLLHWPQQPQQSGALADGIFERIRQILSGCAPTALAKADLIPLIRQHLLRESNRIARPINLRVSSLPPWPDADEWQAHGVSTMELDRDQLHLTAMPWHPTWLSSGDDGAFAAAFTDRQVRPDCSCPADPFVADATGYPNYSCPGQREAVRAAFLMKPGHTLVVNLPTGSGKSLVGQAPALVFKETGHLTLFVVPTVALALDQERQMRS
jgi:ATP-dependent DNA helicase RecQ